MKTKLIGKYTESYLAHIHKGVLAENGIDSFIFGENFMNTAPYFTGLLNAGVELRVKEEDEEEAKKILNIEYSNPIQCSNCQSHNISFSFGENKFSHYFLSILTAFLLVLPFGNLQRHYFCKECGFKMQK